MKVGESMVAWLEKSRAIFTFGMIQVIIGCVRHKRNRHNLSEQIGADKKYHKLEIDHEIY
jgi:hypothetical protein